MQAPLFSHIVPDIVRFVKGRLLLKGFKFKSFQTYEYFCQKNLEKPQVSPSSSPDIY